MQKKLRNRRTNDELINEALLRSIDTQIEHSVNQIEGLQRNIKEFDMQIKQLNFQRRKILKKGWKKALSKTQ